MTSMERRVNAVQPVSAALNISLLIVFLGSAPATASLIQQTWSRLRTACGDLLTSSGDQNDSRRERRVLRAKPNYDYLSLAALGYFAAKDDFFWTWAFADGYARLEFSANTRVFNDTFYVPMRLLALLTHGYVGRDKFGPQFSLNLTSLKFRVLVNDLGALNGPIEYSFDDVRAAFGLAQELVRRDAETSVAWIEIRGEEHDLKALQKGLNTSLRLTFPFAFAIEEHLNQVH